MMCGRAYYREIRRNKTITACAEFARQGGFNRLIYNLLIKNDVHSLSIMEACAGRLITSEKAADLLMILRTPWWKRLWWKFVSG